MAGFLYVTEYGNPFVDARGGMPMVLGPKMATNNITLTASSVQSNAFGATTRIIRVHNDATQPVAVEVGGTNPVATVAGATGSQRMAPSATEYFYVVPGDKIAAIIST